MITIEQIDFSKLKPYEGKVSRSFEQLCYQLAQMEYGHLGRFTPIDGSGGDGGVEFYLIRDNGEKWGWQCKFFGNSGRLNTGNRKNQISKSLETACRNHDDLSKWILCLKTDLTEDSLSAKGKKTLGEQTWFKKELPKKIPSGRSLQLNHWGASHILTLLKSPKNIGIKSFFFGDLEFTPDWFRAKYNENIEKVKDKYDPDLHSIDGYHQSIIDFSLFDTNYCIHLDYLKKELLEKSNQLSSSIKKFRDEKFIGDKEAVQRNNYILYCEECKKHISFVFEKIEYIENCFKNFKESDLNAFSVEDLWNDFKKYLAKIDYDVFNEKSTAFREASSISYLISEFGNIYNRFFRNYFHESQSEIHFIAGAAKGKTHLACDIAFRKIQKDEPAIFFTGDKFTDETSITDAILKILDISHSFTFDELIKTLDVYGSIIKSKIPIIIDGLNETTYNRLFSPIWRNHLVSLTSKLSTSQNIVIITTCRQSYKDRIWDSTGDQRFQYLSGFEDYDTTLDAISKYFNKYKIKADLFFASLEKFKDPIFLKIFCEIKNPNWEKENIVEVNIEEESTYSVFNEYLKQVNRRVTINSHLLKDNQPFVFDSLSKLSNYLWENGLREIPIKEFYNLIDEGQEYEKDKSKAELLIHEGLVITRDMREDYEYVSFTYDMLAGNIIGENLIKNVRELDYFISNKFINKILQEKGQHPLFEDVMSSLCLLLPQIKQTALHDIIQNDKKFNFTQSKLFKYLPKFIKNFYSRRIQFVETCFHNSITALFLLPAAYLKPSDVSLVQGLFSRSNQNKKILFELSLKTLSDTNHPLNGEYISKLLFSMEMNQRDITWTEFIREKAYDLEKYLEEFEGQCKNRTKESSITINKQHLLSNVILWFLTCTNRNLRDETTRALYYYGRKFPVEFSSLVYESLQINDPYVWERSLASLYGVAMAEHNSLISDRFKNEVLPQIGKTLYGMIFSENAIYSTTHILARDYARRIIEISILHHPKLLTTKEIKNVRPPYKFGGIRNLGEYDYGDKEFDYSGPINMDFSNYTIGRIVKDGGSYANPPEKIKVRRQIYWRIFDLGWNIELFKDAETALSNEKYYLGRTERAKVERYGKKYSWIAYYENAGLRDDLGLIERDWDRFRISGADIDLSFPTKPINELFISDDLLGDRRTPLEDWFENGGMPYIEKYLSMIDIKNNPGEWICLDGFICQEDVPANRRRFTFIRGFIVKENEFSEVLGYLQKQNLGGRWLPEKRENYYTYVGELYYCSESTYHNIALFEFETAIKKIKIKKGDPRYFKSFFWRMDDFGKHSSKEFPDEIEQEYSEFKEFEVLMPVMEYNWEGYHSHVNDAGSMTVVAKEIANYLRLVDQPQTFDLFEPNGDVASKCVHYYSDYNNNHDLVYIRKDLLQKFLSENKMKFVWAVWGEREVRFQTDSASAEFFKAHPFQDYQVFQKIVEFKD